MPMRVSLFVESASLSVLWWLCVYTYMHAQLCNASFFPAYFMFMCFVIYIYVCVWIPIDMSVCVYLCIVVYIYIYIYIYIRIRIHIHIHIRTHTQACSCYVHIIHYTYPTLSNGPLEQDGSDATNGSDKN